MDIEAPLTLTQFNLYAFSQAFGAIPFLYVDNGIVKNDIISDSYKQALTCSESGMRMGLLDKNFASATELSVHTAMILGDSAATVAATGGGIGYLMNSGQKMNDGYRLEATKYPVCNKGMCQSTGSVQIQFLCTMRPASLLNAVILTQQQGCWTMDTARKGAFCLILELKESAIIWLTVIPPIQSW